jgi:hypothetical protein
MGALRSRESQTIVFGFVVANGTRFHPYFNVGSRDAYRIKSLAEMRSHTGVPSTFPMHQYDVSTWRPLSDRLLEWYGWDHDGQWLDGSVGAPDIYAVCPESYLTQSDDLTPREEAVMESGTHGQGRFGSTSRYLPGRMRGDGDGFNVVIDTAARRYTEVESRTSAITLAINLNAEVAAPTVRLWHDVGRSMSVWPAIPGLPRYIPTKHNADGVAGSGIASFSILDTENGEIAKYGGRVGARDSRLDRLVSGGARSGASWLSPRGIPGRSVYHIVPDWEALNNLGLIKEDAKEPEVEVTEENLPEDVDGLRAEVLRLRAREETIWRGLEAEAERRDWCPEYDRFAESLGGPTRASRQRRFRYAVTVSVEMDQPQSEQVQSGTTFNADALANFLGLSGWKVEEGAPTIIGGRVTSSQRAS